MKKAYVRPEIVSEAIEEDLMLNTSGTTSDYYDEDPNTTIDDDINIFTDPLTPPPTPTIPGYDDGSDD